MRRYDQEKCHVLQMSRGGVIDSSISRATESLSVERKSFIMTNMLLLEGRKNDLISIERSCRRLLRVKKVA